MVYETHFSQPPRIGEIYFMEFDGQGSCQSGFRPGLVFQNNVGNRFSPNIIALPLTTSLKKTAMPTHVLVDAEETGLFKDSMIICESPESVSKQKIGRYITRLPDKYMKKVAEASLVATSAIAFLSVDEIVRIWKRSEKLNNVAN